MSAIQQVIKYSNLYSQFIFNLPIFHKHCIKKKCQGPEAKS